jgi:hypothetical protein
MFSLSQTSIYLPNPRTQTTIHEKNNNLLPKKWSDDFEQTCECKPFNNCSKV